MISRFDDFCVHQTPDYIAIPASPHRNFYDRYFFSGYRRDGSVIFGVAFGRYPNRGVEDAHFSVAVGDQQISLHASQPAGVDPSRTRVGPISVEVIEPMRRLRCHGAGEGLRFDLTFTALTAAIDEGRLVIEPHIDQTRFMQYGRWSGTIEIDGAAYEIAPRECFGLRDKSWGLRLFAENQTTAEPGGQIFWMNVVTLTERGYSVVRTLRDSDGRPRENEGYYAPVYTDPLAVPIGGEALDRIADWEFALEFADRTRRIRGGSYRATLPDGRQHRFRGRALGSFWYAGLGYNHDRWNHGLSHGPTLAVEREEWRRDSVDMARLDRQFLLSVLEIREGGKLVGFGHTEQLLMGAYNPLGWTADQYVGL